MKAPAQLLGQIDQRGLGGVVHPEAGLVTQPAMEALLITEPPCSPIHAVAARLVHSSGAHRFTSKVLRELGVVLVDTGP